MSRRTEYLLQLLGMPRTRTELPTLSAESEHRILNAVTYSLNGRTITEHRRKLLLRRIAYARVSYRRLHKNMPEDKDIISLLFWEAAHNRLLTNVVEGIDSFY